MAMTEEEKRIARNEASKRWYAAHKAGMSAKNRLDKKTKDTPNRGPDVSKLEKSVDKFIDKTEKTVDSFKTAIKDASSLLGDVFKTGDEKLIARTCKAFGKRLSLEVRQQAEEGKAEIAVSIGAKLFRIPKTKPAEAKSDDENEFAETKVVSVDPSLLTGIEEGSVTASDIDSQQDDPDDEREDETEEKDPDDMDDEEYKEYLERQADAEAESWASGMADTMREMEEQGAYDGFEN